MQQQDFVVNQLPVDVDANDDVDASNLSFVPFDRAADPIADAVDTSVADAVARAVATEKMAAAVAAAVKAICWPPKVVPPPEAPEAPPPPLLAAPVRAAEERARIRARCIEENRSLQRLNSFLVVERPGGSMNEKESLSKHVFFPFEAARGGVTKARVPQRCSLCGRPGHKRQTCRRQKNLCGDA